MKITPSPALVATITLLAMSSVGITREFGISSSARGFGTRYETQRGGSAYVGPRGAAIETAGGNTAVAGPRGAAYSGENVTAVSGVRGAAYSGPNTTAIATDRVAAVEGSNNAAVAIRPQGLPNGYVRTLPAPCTAVVYGGYSCLYSGGLYYRPVMYAGQTVYVIVP